MLPETRDEKRLRRWRLILGDEDADGTGVSLAGTDLAIDRALQALYDSDRRGLPAAVPRRRCAARECNSLATR